MANGHLMNKSTNTNFGGEVINPHVFLQEDSKRLMAYPDTFRRFFGETDMNAEPMVTGFGIVFFTQLPHELNDSTNANYLTAMTTQLDIPDMTMNSIDYEGRNGGQWHVPGSTTIGNDLTFGFWEMRGIPVYRMIARWIHIMRNPHYGFNLLEPVSSNRYDKTVLELLGYLKTIRTYIAYIGYESRNNTNS